ncbi:DUF177 domain-containing protein [Vulcanococcus limneticus Candia 3F8]|uniref:YceD family protein n=1 Tax=Vulcanococcus limneticus TaxID=2170428 RepID=UPI000B97D219|nr:DUF177 domain-containing protein [Vulcanococcus limneticus]MCP9790852.1 DUF177 domain-containing protein [Vulcanococcus limneticus MW73D5]MCP9892805.1 DUF177 domain-containing protein [Vulcanococcus limneticus Candia 3F8]MCP9896459.1 DUF177 domain-containing protein [Vulcanococcus limneticus Candia 3B3]
MADDLRPVPIQELRPLAEGRRWTIDQHLGELESLTPVRGELQAIHRGNVLEVAGLAETIVTLCCDRCLQHFNHPLAFRTKELLWLGDAARDAGLSEDDVLEAGAQVLDIEADALTESLDPRGDFDPAHWAFEQLSLQLPVVNRCGPECPGPNLRGSGPGEAIDPRWAALKNLTP